MKSIAELKAIRDKTRREIDMREDKDAGTRVVVGMATCGIAAGARPVLNAFMDEIANEKIDNVTVTQTGCIGICQYEPVAEVYQPDGSKITYVHLTAEKAIRIVNNHLKNGEVVTEYTIGANSNNK